MPRLLALLALGLTGCILPLSTAAPQSATTVGKGRFGATLYAEAPTVDLLAAEDDPGKDLANALAPSPTMSLQVAYGLTDRLDLEVAADGTLLYFVVPAPLGGSAGARYQILRNERVALAAAGRVGRVSATAEWDGEDIGGSALYGGLTVAAQAFPRGVVRPGLAISYLPISIAYEHDGGETDRFTAHVASLTASLTFAAGGLELAPFGNVAFLSSDYLDGRFLATGGLSIALRPRRRAAE